MIKKYCTVLLTLIIGLQMAFAPVRPQAVKVYLIGDFTVADSNGQKDNIHFQPEGAQAVAQLVFNGLKNIAGKK